MKQFPWVVPLPGVLKNPSVTCPGHLVFTGEEAASAIQQPRQGQLKQTEVNHAQASLLLPFEDRSQFAFLYPGGPQLS